MGILIWPVILSFTQAAHAYHRQNTMYESMLENNQTTRSRYAKITSSGMSETFIYNEDTENITKYANTSITLMELVKGTKLRWKNCVKGFEERILLS